MPETDSVGPGRGVTPFLALVGLDVILVVKTCISICDLRLHDTHLVIRHGSLRLILEGIGLGVLLKFIVKVFHLALLLNIDLHLLVLIGPHLI